MASLLRQSQNGAFFSLTADVYGRCLSGGTGQAVKKLPVDWTAANDEVLFQSTVGDLSLSLFDKSTCSRFGANQNWLHQIRAV